jgi:site-specific recombinase XerD
MNLREHLEHYLTLRRALGFTLKEEGKLLAKFVTSLETSGATTITSDVAIAWAKEPVGVSPNCWAKRLGVVRHFCVYLATIDETTEVPPTGVFPTSRHRPTPYLWKEGEITALLEATAQLRPPFRAATHEALFGLLAATGMRLGEATGLLRDDVDLAAGVITIRHAKFDRERLVPLHQSTTAALRAYATRRDARWPASRERAFFCSSVGTALFHSGVQLVMQEITTQLGLRRDGVRPRIHDLRHSFAVRTLLEWQRAGVSVDANIATLSTYLGHVAPSDTYWYLSASPELMALAATRLDARYGADQ